MKIFPDEGFSLTNNNFRGKKMFSSVSRNCNFRSPKDVPPKFDLQKEKQIKSKKDWCDQKINCPKKAIIVKMW